MYLYIRLGDSMDVIMYVLWACDNDSFEISDTKHVYYIGDK